MNRIASASAARSANSAMRAKKNVAARQIQRAFRGYRAKKSNGGGLQKSLLMARRSLRRSSVRPRSRSPSSIEKFRQSLVRARGGLRKVSTPTRPNARQVLRNQAAYATVMRSIARDKRMGRVARKMVSSFRARKKAAGTIQRYVRGHQVRTGSNLRNLKLLARANRQLKALERMRERETVLRQASPKRSPVRVSTTKKKTPWLKMLGIGGLLALSGKTLRTNANTHVALRHGHRAYPAANISHVKIHEAKKPPTFRNAHRHVVHTLSGGYFYGKNV